MNILSDIRAAFESRGYERLADAVVASRGDIWYRHESSTAAVEHILYLSYKPSAKAYSVHVGVFNPDVRRAIEGHLVELSRFMEPSYLESPILMKRPCWQMFDAGRALKWDSVFIIPSPRDQNSWTRLFESLFSDFVEPFFFSISDANGIMELLLRNDPPFEWFLTSPVLRIAEIAALGKIPKADQEVLRKKIDAFSDAISRRIPGANYNEAVNVIFEHLYR